MTAASASETKGVKDKASDEKKRHSVFARIVLFIRQILTELKKVQRPIREELGQMLPTALAFMVIIMIVVGLLGLGFGRLTFWVFRQPPGFRVVLAARANEQKAVKRG